jgi:cholestenol delta-isomerase
MLIWLLRAQFGLGPLCLITAWLISRDSGYRHSFQALVSAGHLYSNLVYFATSLYDDYILGKKYYRPEPVYFWAYFVGMNAIWLVVPARK